MRFQSRLQTMKLVPKRDFLLFSAAVLPSVLLVISVHYLYPNAQYKSSSIDNIGKRLLEAYDPIANKQVLEQRVRHSCHVKLPTTQQLAQYPFRQGAYRHQWALSRFLSYYNIHAFLSTRWRARTPSSHPRLQVLDAGGSRFLTPFRNILNIKQTSFPAVDLHRTPFADASFDVIAADQVLEHTAMPYLIFMEMHRLLRPGGLAIVTSISFNPLHEARGSFHDFWRFMPDGLRVLSLPFKGGIKICGAWGSKSFITTRVKHGMGSTEEKLFHDTNFDQLAAQNDHVHPFLVWMIVEK